MKNPPVTRMRKEANELLFSAHSNLTSSPNQVDTQLICMNCKRSIIKYLESYLMENGVAPNSLNTMSVLFEQCKNVDPLFIDFDMTKLNCRFEMINEDTCSDLVHLRECVDMTKSIKVLTS